jgi:hypothetical protein
MTISPLVDRLGQVFPGGRHGQVLGLEPVGVHTEGGYVAGGREPLLVGALVLGGQGVHALGRIGFQQVLQARIQHVADGEAPDHVLLRIGGLGDQAGAQVAGGQPQHVDLHVRHGGVGGFQIGRDFVFFEGGVDGDGAGMRLRPT